MKLVDALQTKNTLTENGMVTNSSSLNDCVNLQEVLFDYNQLTGDIPNLQYCQQLTNVDFGTNQLTGYISASGCTLSPTLLTFTTGYNSLTQTAVDNILYDLVYDYYHQ